MEKGYDIAQICLNGHVANSSSLGYPQFNKVFCDECGKKTITNCPNCENAICGAYLDSMSLHYDIPKYCIHCGNTFPWTEGKIRAAYELAKEMSNLTEQERDILERSVEDLVNDTPSTPVAITRFKKIMVKVGSDAAGLFKEILKDILDVIGNRVMISE